MCAVSLPAPPREDPLLRRVFPIGDDGRPATPGALRPNSRRRSGRGRERSEVGDLRALHLPHSTLGHHRHRYRSVKQAYEHVGFIRCVVEVVADDHLDLLCPAWDALRIRWAYHEVALRERMNVFDGAAVT